MLDKIESTLLHMIVQLSRGRLPELGSCSAIAQPRKYTLM
jgi:hypothetical protein